MSILEKGVRENLLGGENKISERTSWLSPGDKSWSKANLQTSGRESSSHCDTSTTVMLSLVKDFPLLNTGYL